MASKCNLVLLVGLVLIYRTSSQSPIQNCSQVSNQDGKEVCLKCNKGYRVDPYGSCFDCDDGYILTSSNPFECAVGIPYCNSYINSFGERYCFSCVQGFSVGCKGYCCECGGYTGYIQVSSNPIECIMKISNCTSYEKYDNTWGCGECMPSRKVDILKKCEACSDDYYQIPSKSLECMPKIKGCEVYSKIGTTCETCEPGFIPCHGKCCECNPGYYSSREQPDKCTKCPNKCSTCRVEEDGLHCLSCVVGYILANGGCECDSEDFYPYQGECMPKPFDVSLEYQENGIFIVFSKRISKPLSMNDITITFHDEMDMRLLRYSLITLLDMEVYMIEFYFSLNIQTKFDISIEFSDNITDRQNTKLSSSVAYTTLPLLVEGITARSELCDKSCKKCDLMNGRVTCIECYDFAQVFEGVCKCYDEEGTDPLACPMKCPDNMRIDTKKNTCVICEECNEDSLLNYNDENDSLSSENIKEISDSSYSTSSLTASAVAIGSAVAADKMWSFMNTVQIYSYMPLIQVNMPISLRETLKSQDSTNKYLNAFEELFVGGKKPYSRAVEFRFIKQEEFLKTWGTFFDEFQILDKKVHGVYYVLFFMRRLIMAAAFVLLRRYSLTQVILCETSCLIILLYLAIYKPYKTKFLNAIQILNELSISVAYMLSGIFYFDTGLDSTIHSWIILSCVYFSYIIHLIGILLNLGKLLINLSKKHNIKDKILTLLRRREARSTAIS